MLKDINLKSIKSYVQGNYRYHTQTIFPLANHLKEQYYYRLYVCKDDCLITGTCMNCTCPTIKKAFATDSCNKDRFPEFLSGGEWREYKKEHKIENIEEIIKEVEDAIHKE